VPISRELHEEHGVRWEAARTGAADAEPAGREPADAGPAGAEPAPTAPAAPELPRNYGDPPAEYHAARNSVAICDRRDRRFLRVHGRDPVRMVQGLASNDIAAASAARAVYATVLTPKGKMVADVRVLRRGDELLLEADAAAVDGLAAHLRKFVPPLFARFEAAPSWTALTVCGPNARALLEAETGVTLPDAGDEDAACDVAFGDTPGVIVATSHTDVPAYDLLVEGASADDAWRRLTAAGAVPLGHATLDVLRIEAGTPRWGAELTEATIPLEAGLRRRAISETKGCYTGQEVIVRILHRGHVNWLLRGVLLGDAAAPGRDAPLFRDSDGRQVGRITSAAWSPKHGQEIALAYVRREVEPPAPLRLGAADGPEVTVVALPFGG
jgi:folate-binding protein YgfZ